jgi:hypothetical protein
MNSYFEQIEEIETSSPELMTNIVDFIAFIKDVFCYFFYFLYASYIFITYIPSLLKAFFEDLKDYLSLLFYHVLNIFITGSQFIFFFPFFIFF